MIVDWGSRVIRANQVFFTSSLAGHRSESLCSHLRGELCRWLLLPELWLLLARLLLLAGYYLQSTFFLHSNCLHQAQTSRPPQSDHQLVAPMSNHYLSSTTNGIFLSNFWPQDLFVVRLPLLVTPWLYILTCIALCVKQWKFKISKFQI